MGVSRGIYDVLPMRQAFEGAGGGFDAGPRGVFVLVGMVGVTVLDAFGMANFSIKPAAVVSILLGGSLAAAGMPRFDDLLSAEDARAIQAFILEQARLAAEAP